ncbi:FAD/NAD(P)-binding domain-containing protein [Mytilinidion resinicola]|uniref:FAD/NAD(P)-binding domain-containing protein n=1 Tax=Mytilinidion resinicola TaxID=574789 RepID=A0A6A6Y3L8_9PEZI|nr:FAD/NAD(P)-binding domain-containing protein [Mytilinidion resinicola]KAF2802377.1 FAD/NAD(P)-binding domain-containing protein [Mytilinidion resinicola]
MPSIAAAEALQELQQQLPKNLKPGESTEAYKDRDHVAYALSQLPLGTRRPLKVVAVGAGFSGLSIAREVEVGSLQNVSLTVFEKNASVGGTWYENRYPGCACDIPIHNYQFSWAPYPHFPSYYAAGEAIHQYMEDVADQHNLRKYIKTSHKVIGAKWIEERQKWQVQVVETDGRDLMVSNRETKEGEKGAPFIEECDVFLNATGCFNDWKWPNIAGREKYRGELLHSASWPKSTNLAGKTVALIGNGSTGVQILPAILDQVEKVYVFIRSRTWITAGFAQKYAGPNGTNVVFSEEQKKRWEENPDEYLEYRKAIELELNSRFRLYLKDSPEQKEALDFSINQMAEKLAVKPEIIEKLVPDFAVGFVPPFSTPHSSPRHPTRKYWKILICADAAERPRVEIVWGEIGSFEETGLTSKSGALYAVDTIICATGFNMSFSPRFPTIGQNGVDLQKKWDISPECYLSVTAADMPNYFIYLGPGSPIGHGSVVTALQRVTQYIVKFITKLQVQNYSSVVPKPHIPRAYQKHALAWLEKTSWSSHCVSTYKNGKQDGDLISLHPGSRLHYFYLLDNPRFEDFDWKSLCDDPDLTFAWLGNGFIFDESQSEISADLTWYLEPVEKEKHIKATKETPQEIPRTGAKL